MAKILFTANSFLSLGCANSLLFAPVDNLMEIIRQLSSEESWQRPWRVVTTSDANNYDVNDGKRATISRSDVAHLTGSGLASTSHRASPLKR